MNGVVRTKVDDCQVRLWFYTTTSCFSASDERKQTAFILRHDLYSRSRRGEVGICGPRALLIDSFTLVSS